MDSLDYADEDRGADARRVTFVPSVESDGVISRRRPVVGNRSGQVGEAGPVAKIPSVRGGVSKDLPSEVHDEPHHRVRRGGLNRDAQRAGDGAGVVFVAADGGRIKPRFTVNIRAGGVSSVAGGAAGRAGAEVKRIGQLRFGRDVAGAAV